MSEINTVIFDLDGTLLNTLGDLADAVNFALRQYGYPERSIEEVRCFVGNGVSKLMELSIPEGKNNPEFGNCLAVFKNYYSKNMQNKTCPYDGIMDLLEALRKEGCRTAIVSNKFDAAVKELNRRYFDGYIGIAAGESESVHRKPAPDCVNLVLRKLGSTAKEAVYVGDSEVDIKTAHNAGLPCICVTWGFRGREFLEKEGADRIISHPSELLDLLGEPGQKS